MFEVKVSVITKNAFIYEAIIHILKKIAIPHIQFIIKKNDDYLLDKDIVFYETVPGELFLPNAKFMNCKPARILFILHNYTDGFCFDDVKRFENDTFTFSMKNNTVEQLMITIKHGLINYTHSQSCSIQEEKIEKRVRINLSKKQSEITIQLANGLDLKTISSLNKVTVNTIKYHIKEIKKKMKLASTYELYQFAHMLKSLTDST
ncbi:TPA: hypothetical protein M4196_004704 [Klebsiella variicola]|uniref:helix-turn-helix transcriptional regulator n=1 Tax=Klebsiella variicola TaxID=244366 RepID=UPI0023758D78|nr:LuxR C-terminal-related transcriptional regulator [Klebsiella variicola]HCC2891601.1 hypothetical protein [Klebsiella variicola]HDK6409526.1 hypothetical protein [Klebsiella variicola]